MSPRFLIDSNPPQRRRTTAALLPCRACCLLDLTRAVFGWDPALKALPLELLHCCASEAQGQQQVLWVTLRNASATAVTALHACVTSESPAAAAAASARAPPNRTVA